jgi:hypothetical protein
MYRLSWRTAKPLEPLTAPGCDNVMVERMLPINPPIQNRTWMSPFIRLLSSINFVSNPFYYSWSSVFGHDNGEITPPCGVPASLPSLDSSSEWDIMPAFNQAIICPLNFLLVFSFFIKYVWSNQHQETTLHLLRVVKQYTT